MSASSAHDPSSDAPPGHRSGEGSASILPYLVESLKVKIAQQKAGGAAEHASASREPRDGGRAPEAH